MFTLILHGSRIVCAQGRKFQISLKRSNFVVDFVFTRGSSWQRFLSHGFILQDCYVNDECMRFLVFEYEYESKKLLRWVLWLAGKWPGCFIDVHFVWKSIMSAGGEPSTHHRRGGPQRFWVNGLLFMSWWRLNLFLRVSSTKKIYLKGLQI